MNLKVLAALQRVTATSAWYRPDQGELAKEYKEEPSLMSYTENVSGLFWQKSVELKEAFFTLMKLAEVKTFTSEEIYKIDDIPAVKGSTLEDVGNIVTRYGGPKDWDRIVDRVKNGKKMPMPIVEKEAGGYKALGGRTRLSAAAILEVPIQVLVLDTKKIKPEFFDIKFDREMSVFQFFPEGKDYGEAYTKFLMGLYPKEPEVPHGVSKEDVKHIQREAKDIAKLMKDYQ